MKSLTGIGFRLLLVVVLLGCAPVAARDVPSPRPAEDVYQVNREGKAVYGGEFEFLPLPSEWELLSHADGGDSVIIFYRKDPGSGLARTLIIYNEEPYGYSRELDKRSTEFMKRFLWDSYLTKEVLERKAARALGGEALTLVVAARDPVEGNRVRARIVFAHRGERVVSFQAIQWRTTDEPFDPAAFTLFDRFVDSFRTLKKSFYEQL